MTNQPADLWASSRLFLAVCSANDGPLGLGSPCLSLSCCPRRPHSPLDSGVRPQPLLSPPLPSTLPSPTDPLAESVGTICAGEVTFSLPGCYFLFCFFFFFVENTKHRAYLRNTCLTLWFSLPLLHRSCLHNTALGLWQHTHTGRMSNLDMRWFLFSKINGLEFQSLHWGCILFIHIWDRAAHIKIKMTKEEGESMISAHLITNCIFHLFCWTNLCCLFPKKILKIFSHTSICHNTLKTSGCECSNALVWLIATFATKPNFPILFQLGLSLV